MPIVYLPKADGVDIPGWSNLSVTAIIPTENGKLGEGDFLIGGNDAATSIVATLWGKPPAKPPASSTTPRSSKAHSRT